MTQYRILALATSFIVGSASAASAADSTSQFISKVYTEGLGRAPDAASFSGLEQSYSKYGCSVATLSSTVSGVLNSSEFDANARLPNGSYDNDARILDLYRAALNRDPSPPELANGLTQLQSQTWGQVVASVLASSNFSSLANTICSLNSNGIGAYGWGGDQSLNLLQSGSGASFSGSTAAQLNSALKKAKSLGTTIVTLAPGAAITVDQTVVVPAGITLQTIGTPAPNQYGMMARFIRTKNNYTSYEGCGLEENHPSVIYSMVEVCPGAKLESVWVDGNRTSLGHCFGDTNNNSCLSVQLDGGQDTSVINSRLSDSDGWTNLAAYGGATSGIYSGCGSTTANVVSGNLSTQYATNHFDVFTNGNGGYWSDGLSIGCARATVSANSVVDATDVGIVLFDGSNNNVGYPTDSQSSTVENNVIINSGNPAFAGIVADGQTDVSGNPQPQTCPSGGTKNFASASVINNNLWTGIATYVDVLLSVGSRQWYGRPNQLEGLPNTSFGITVTGNTTAGIGANVNAGLVVDGMCNATVQNNVMQFDATAHDNCYSAPFIAAQGYAEGSVLSNNTIDGISNANYLYIPSTFNSSGDTMRACISPDH